LGIIKSLAEWDWDGAEREFLRAIDLNPGYADVHYTYGYVLMIMARFEEALREMELALQLDPLSLIINRNLGQLFYRSRQYDKAIEALRKTLEMDPNFSHTHLYLGTTYLQKSMYKDALAEFHKEKDLRKEEYHTSEARIAVTNALMGKRKEALQMLNDLLERSKHIHVSPCDIAYIHVALGENDLCIEYLEKAYEEHENELRFLKVEPLFENIRSDPRFKALLKKIGLEE
jgi:adenylate cyclase